jgi:hypothetical protein
VVARWLGLAEPSYSGRMAARGLAHFPDGHGLEPKFLQFIGRGFRSGMRPCMLALMQLHGAGHANDSLLASDALCSARSVPHHALHAPRAARARHAPHGSPQLSCNLAI